MRYPIMCPLIIVTLLIGCSENSNQETEPRTINPPENQLKRLILSTRDSALSTYDKEGFVFKYGVDAQNALNTFEGTYTLVADTGRSPSIRLALSPSEIDSVLAMMNAIGFFSSPDTFAYVTKGDRVSSVAGSGTAVYFGVRYFLSGVLRQKELWWVDHAYSEDDPDERAIQLRTLIFRTRMLIEENPAVKKMPRPFRFRRYD